jgi:ribose/xylose/arabinose/galactoside ABC-type transport system permease subunit
MTDVAAQPLLKPNGSERPERVQFRIARRKMLENSIALIAFLAIFGVLGLWTNGLFFNVDGRLLDVHGAVPILLLGLAALVTLITGQFDLSVAGVATMSCFSVIGLTVRQDFPFTVVLLVTLCLGLIVGLVNGFLIEHLKVNAFIATLGTGAVCAGLSAVYSGGTFIGPGPADPQLPQWFVAFGSNGSKAPSVLIWLAVIAALALFFVRLDRLRPPSRSPKAWPVVKAGVVIVAALLLVFVFNVQRWVAGVSWMVFALMIIGLLLWVLLQATTYGRHIQAIGSNRSAALLAGVKVRRQTMKTFVLGGILASIGGIALAASQGSASPDAAASFLLPAFSAAFLSTVILSDGRFRVLGTILGGVFLTWVGLGLIVGGLSPTWVNVINGAVLLAAVALSTAVRARR